VTLSLRGLASEEPVTFNPSPSQSSRAHGNRTANLKSSDLAMTMDVVVEEGYELMVGKDGDRLGRLPHQSSSEANADRRG
jgi:hypothetical protein